MAIEKGEERVDAWPIKRIIIRSMIEVAYLMFTVAGRVRSNISSSQY
jgi:hypothetical protein